MNDRPETRIVLRPLASPLPLGFLGLAAATFVVSGLNLGWVDASEGRDVALVVVAFTVPLQFLAAVIGFLARDGIVATAMGLLSGIWLGQALVLQGAEPGSTSDALGLFLLVGGVAMLVPASGAAGAKLVPAAVLTTAAVRFLVTGVYQLTASAAWKEAAGIVGLVLTVLALYAAWAALLEDVEDVHELPFGRRRRAKQATGEGASAAGTSILREPGVRGQL